MPPKPATDKCHDCGNKLPPNMAFRCRLCPMCKVRRRGGFLPLTPEEAAVVPLVPRTVDCQHCLDYPPEERFTYVKDKLRAYWLCWGCRMFAGQNGLLPLLIGDYYAHPELFEPDTDW